MYYRSVFSLQKALRLSLCRITAHYEQKRNSRNSCATIWRGFFNSEDYAFSIRLHSLNRISWVHFHLLYSDINECQASLHNCSSNANCRDTNGSYRCECFSGYDGSGLLCSSMCLTLSSLNDIEWHCSSDFCIGWWNEIKSDSQEINGSPFHTAEVTNRDGCRFTPSWYTEKKGRRATRFASRDRGIWRFVQAGTEQTDRHAHPTTVQGRIASTYLWLQETLPYFANAEGERVCEPEGYRLAQRSVVLGSWEGYQGAGSTLFRETEMLQQAVFISLVLLKTPLLRYFEKNFLCIRSFTLVFLSCTSGRTPLRLF